ncbi:MAG TPA: sugar porter family MFS transporter [Bryobacteraceae bacterium]|nr:sugar porter family MFS transporter [Bryobacteraceae bacterium]
MTIGQNNRVQDASRHTSVVLIAAVAAVCGLLFGYDTGVISGALLFIKSDFVLSPLMQGVVTSAVLAGATLGAGFSGRLADRFGRRAMILAVAVLFFVSSLMTSLAPDVGWLAVGRIFVGLAIGVCSYTGPLYISEISPAASRGALVSLNQLLITVGILVSYLADYLLAAGEHWRWMFAVAAIPAVILGAGMLALPESPRWLAARGRHEAARAVLRRVRCESEAETELREIEAQGQGQEASWKELLEPRYRPALLVGIGLAIFQQITGINTIIYYAPTIFQMAGYSSAAQSILATAGVGLVNVLLTIVSLRLLDRVGRRPLLLFGVGGMTVCLAALGFVFKFSAGSSSLGWLAVISVMAYVACFAISLGPIFWLIISEIYPLRVRGLAMGVATMANWGFNLIVALTFLLLVQGVGAAGAFWLYAMVSIGAWVFSRRYVPETKGRTLEEITEHWHTLR